MDFTQALELIRDEVGSTPDDDTLEELYDLLENWMLVALRVLRRRYADAAGGGQSATSFTLSGVMSVGLSKTDLTSLQTQINRLQGLYDASRGRTLGQARIVRDDR